MTAIEKTLSDYEARILTERERVVALARLVTLETVETIFASIPPEVGEELLNWARAALRAVLGTHRGRHFGCRLPSANKAREAVVLPAPLQPPSTTTRRAAPFMTPPPAVS